MTRLQGGLLLLATALAGCSGGETPTGAYMAYRKAFDAAQTIEELKPFMDQSTRARAEAAPPEETKRLFPLIKGLSEVVDVTVTKEMVTGDEAVLEVTGLNVAMGNDARASVQMAREGGVWKVKKESWRVDDTAPRPPERTCPELLADLKGAAVGPRARAVTTLGQRACADVVPELVGLLRDPSPAISTNASGALRMNMQDDPQRYASFLPALVAAKAAAASSESVMMQANLQQALTRLGPPAIPGLVADLQHSDRDMRWGAAAGLGMMGPAARETLPALEAAARAEKDGTVRDRMLEAINQVRR